MKVAAIQMRANLARVDENLKAAERLATLAFEDGAEWVVLPEFFTTAMAYNPQMLDGARPIDGEPFMLLTKLAKKHNGVIGGSFIAMKDNDSYNTFVLAFPDGTVYFHDKDQPTMWENCYYLGGSDEGILKTETATVGVALCWEFVRTRTVQRLLNRVDFVVGGSCWWTLPEMYFPGFPHSVHERNLEIMMETPARFAKMLGVPVIHASHAGEIEGKLPLVPGFPYKSHLLGETQIVDGTGQILARMRYEDGEGFITADIDITRRESPTETVPDKFWIPDLPLQIRFMWWLQNLHGAWYYRLKTKHHR